MWTDAAWKRHLEIRAEQDRTREAEGRPSTISGSELDWHYYEFAHHVILLNSATGQEFEQRMEGGEFQHIALSDTLLCCTDKIDWPEGMRPAHYGRNCRQDAMV